MTGRKDPRACRMLARFPHDKESRIRAARGCRFRLPPLEEV